MSDHPYNCDCAGCLSYLECSVGGAIVRVKRDDALSDARKAEAEAVVRMLTIIWQVLGDHVACTDSPCGHRYCDLARIADIVDTARAEVRRLEGKT